MLQHSGLSVDTLRYYERTGLLDPPARDAAGRRLYTEDDLRWLAFLTRLRTTGMPIRRMREYAEERRRGAEGMSRRKELLREQRRALIERIAELQSCLALIEHKTDNYERIEHALAQEVVA